jgi:hypothetical protein
VCAPQRDQEAGGEEETERKLQAIVGARAPRRRSCCRNSTRQLMSLLHVARAAIPFRDGNPIALGHSRPEARATGSAVDEERHARRFTPVIDSQNLTKTLPRPGQTWVVVEGAAHDVLLASERAISASSGGAPGPSARR